LDARAALPQNCSTRKVNLSPNFVNGPSGLDGTHQRAAIHSLNTTAYFFHFDFPVRCFSVAPQGREDRSPESLRSSAFWKSLAMVAGQQAVQAGRTCPKSSEEVLHPLMQEWALRCTELKAMKEWLAARRLSPRSRQSHFLRATTSVIFRREDGLSSLIAAIPRTHGIVGLLAHYFLRALQYLIHG
jgi:hypothetical protein